jgi:signal transduction histidine kinase
MSIATEAPPRSGPRKLASGTRDVSRRRRIAVAAASLVVGLAAMPILTDGDPSAAEAAIVVIVCWGFILVGLIEWSRQPANHVGPLLCIFGLSAVVSTFVAAQSAWAFTLGYALTAVPPLTLAHLLLCYPSGVLQGRLTQVSVRVAYLVVAPLPLLILLVYDPADHRYGLYDCVAASGECRESALLVWDSPSAYRVVFAVQLVLQCVAAVVLTALVARRLLRASPRFRWLFASLLGVGLLVTARVIGANVLFALHEASAYEAELFWGAGIAQAAVGGVLLQGLLRRRLAHAGVGGLVVDLEKAPASHIEEALARAVGDPSLQVAFPLPERDIYVNSRGEPATLPPPGSERAITRLERDGTLYAVVVHDPSLTEEHGLVDAAAAAASLSLQNARLQAEVRAQLLEVEQSRARLVQAADAERRRLERDIHDGAQQRLVALAVALRVAERKLDGADSTEVERVLETAVSELQTAVDELRELARGVYPAILTEEGLGAALESLAGRSSLPVAVELPSRRLPAEIEAAAYFVVCETLANAAKHSGATRVSVAVEVCDGHVVTRVQDDGCGGAYAADGSGLSGLADRVGAHGGTLRVHSPPGQGTLVVAEMPCGP